MYQPEGSKLQALTDISSIDITLDLEQVLEKILDITCRTMDAHSGTLMLVDEETGELSMVASYNLGPDYIQKVNDAAEKAGVKITSSPSGTVLETGQHYLVPDIYKEPKDRPWYDISRELGFSSQIFTPMKRGTRVIGLLNVYMADTHDFTDEEINFVNIAASQAASVVQNVRVCTRLKSNVHELKEYKEHLEEKVKSAYKDLYESEAYLNSVIESSHDGITVMDTRGRFEFANDAFLRMVEWHRSELIGQEFDVILTDELKELGHRFLDEVQKGISNEFELEIVTRSGEEKIVLMAHTLAQINNEMKVISITKDITQHKKLEKKLEESEAKYRELFENAQEGLCTMDMDGRFLTINKAGAAIFGSPKKDIIWTRFTQWMTPDSIEMGEVTFKKFLAGESIDQPVIRELIRKNGERRLLELRMRKIESVDDTIGIHVMFNDITEKKDMDLQLRYYHEKLRMSFEKLKIAELKHRDLFENALDGIYTHDTQGYFQNMNKAGLKILGCTKEELIGTHFTQWLTPQSIEIAKQVMQDFIAGRPVEQPVVLEIVRKDKDHRMCEIKARPIMDGDRVIAVHGIMRDATEKLLMERRLAEYHEQLEASYKELIEADRLKTEFISNITHELLTPLTSIKGFAELMRDEKLGSINDEQKKSLETILRNSARLVRLIKDLLAASQLENGSTRLNFKPVSLNDILSRTIQDIQPIARDKQIDIVQHIQQLPQIYGDEEKLAQTLTNLLVNAIKFTPREGTVIISASEDRGEIRLDISDTGVGFPPEEAERIFDKFYQVDGSNSRKYGGVGLGLSICKSIIEKHHGTISAQSDNNGSTFQIVLPVRSDNHNS